MQTYSEKAPQQALRDRFGHHVVTMWSPRHFLSEGASFNYLILLVGAQGLEPWTR